MNPIYSDFKETKNPLYKGNINNSSIKDNTSPIKKIWVKNNPKNQNEPNQMQRKHKKNVISLMKEKNENLKWIQNPLTECVQREKEKRMSVNPFNINNKSNKHRPTLKKRRSANAGLDKSFLNNNEPNKHILKKSEKFRFEKFPFVEDLKFETGEVNKIESTANQQEVINKSMWSKKIKHKVFRNLKKCGLDKVEKNNIKKFEIIHDLIEHKLTAKEMNLFYGALKQKFHKEKKIDNEALGNCLDELEKCLICPQNLTFDQVNENREFFHIMKMVLEKEFAAELLHFVEDLENAGNAKDLKEHYNKIFKKFLSPETCFSFSTITETITETINLKSGAYNKIKEFFENELHGLIKEKTVPEINKKLLSLVIDGDGFSYLWVDMRSKYIKYQSK